MTQDYNKYTAEDHAIWGILFDRQLLNLEGKACSEYLDCIEELFPHMNNSEVADFRKVEEALAKTGWTIEVVEGLIPVEDFFQLLAQKRFCSSTWLRTRTQLDYLEEPDMFHDTFGHIPLLMNETYAAFMKKFGELGVKHLNDDRALTALQRLYWFTIEFGLMKGAAHAKSGKPQIYGAGVLSSFGEVNHIYEDHKVEVLPYDISAIAHNHFVNSEIQMRYYLIDSFEQLFHSLDEFDVLLEQGLDIEPQIVR
ncbi:MAG: phenylalanine-4-hydroxylase [Flavobacteriales bacterium]